MTTQFNRPTNPFGNPTPEIEMVPEDDQVQTSSEKHSLLAQKFTNLPLRHKQLFALIASEAIAVIGLMGVSSWLVLQNGQSQLSKQAKSELTVSEMAYNANIREMESGFRGQSTNTAIVEAAQAYANGRSLSSGLEQQLKTILSSEITNHQIEYATLVGLDGRIIANANADRAGEKFDPDGLVGTVLKNPRQIAATSIVSGAELKREAPPLPEGFADQDALIRYTLTPVYQQGTEQAIGVLVSGDIVNKKPQIAEATLSGLGNGYSAIYLLQPSGEFALASSLEMSKGQSVEQAKSDVELPKADLLKRAANSSEPVTQRMRVGDQTYIIAAEAIKNFKNEPVAVLVRGTPEAGSNYLFTNILFFQLGVAGLVLLLNLLIAKRLTRSISEPIESLRQRIKQFAAGDRQVRAPILADDEIGTLTQSFNKLADNITASESTLLEKNYLQEISTERAKLFTDIMLRIRDSLNPDDILSTSVEGVRTLLKADRVLIYRFSTDYKSGVISSESVGSGWMKAMGQTIYDPLLPGTVERYKAGRISKINNIAEAQITKCHCEILERLEVQANIVAPIVVGDDLIGLLCVHQCSGPRTWQPAELDLVQQLATQAGYALTQATLLQQQRLSTQRERQLNTLISKMRQSLNFQEIIQTAATEVRHTLAADRVIVYQFDDRWAGQIVAESVEPTWLAIVGAEIEDPCFATTYVEKYKQGRVHATPNIHEAGYTECHLKQLEPFQVKANLVAPILSHNQLFGLLIAHQCDAPRDWQEIDISFIRQAAQNLGFAMEQANLFEQREKARLEAEALSEEQRQQKEAIQMQLINLLTEVEGAARGNLTVRAEVTVGEIGTVADFFNAIIESLGRIVTKVKESSTQVNSSLGENEDAIRQLAEEALQQAEETSQTLVSVEAMTRSIQTVAASAQQAARVARTASTTAETGGTAMDLTVQNILGLRETVGETAKKVKRLGEASQQISKVVSLINQIALQTNLLAINAGIEAARAGEEGQGFAIVAEEVGELAARSAAATREIEVIVETIQRETSQVVEAMEQSTAQVVEGTHLVEGAKQSLSEILEVSRQIDQLVQSISDATVSQVETSESVSKLMKQMTEVSKRTSDSSLQVSSAIRQTVAVARELQASVETFEVGSHE
ncbi:MAG TPA: GAF domain-containing protein [Trichocoleus sp.]|jgi:methyl-accepting chemotaxis protein PixJ